MKPKQLREWLFQNGQEDQWWLCIDTVTEESPLTVAEIEEYIASGDYGTVQALHVSQSEMSNPPWIDVELPSQQLAHSPAMRTPIHSTTAAAASPQNQVASPVSQALGDSAIRMLLPVGRSGWAIAAGYLGLFGLIIIPAPIALIVSIIAILDIRKSKDTDKPKCGMGRAIFGLIVGIVGTVVLALVAILSVADR